MPTKTQGRPIPAPNQGRPCPRSSSVMACSDSCKSCHRFTRTGHDHREPMFRDYLSEAERGHDAWY